MAFQNCSNVGFESVLEDPNSLELASAAPDMKVIEGSLVEPDRMVSPVQIQFGSDLLIGVVDSSANFSSNSSMSADSLTPARGGRFIYELNLRAATVTSLETGGLVWRLDSETREELLSMIKGSLIARQTDFPLPINAANYACPQIFQEAYARLITRSEDFMLGEGSPCSARDLYRQSGANAGLRVYLEKLQALIEGQVSPSQKHLVSLKYVREFGTFQLGAEFRRHQVMMTYEPIKDQYRVTVIGLYAAGDVAASCEATLRGESAQKLNAAAHQVRVVTGEGVPMDAMPASIGLAFSDGSSITGEIGYAKMGSQALVNTTELVTILNSSVSCLTPVFTTNTSASL